MAPILSPTQNAPTLSLPPRKQPSHGRKLSPDHIPRPRNAFILFRTDFVQSSKLTRDTESDHRNISKIAGAIWRTLPQDQKLMWHTKAADEKAAHQLLYPDYRYSPMVRREGINRRKVKQKLWEGIESDDDDTATESTPPSDLLSSSLSSATLIRISPNDEEDGASPYSPASPLTMTPSTSQSRSTSTAPSDKKPKERCDVIALLYSRGLRGEELQAEVKRREEEGRKRRRLQGGDDDEPPQEKKKPSRPRTKKASTKASPKKRKKNDPVIDHAVEPSTVTVDDAHYPASTTPFPRANGYEYGDISPSASALSSGDDIFSDVPIPIFINASLLPMPITSSTHHDSSTELEADSYRMRWLARAAACPPNVDAASSAIKNVECTATEEPFQSPIPRPPAPLQMSLLLPMPQQHGETMCFDSWTSVQHSQQDYSSTGSLFDGQRDEGHGPHFAIDAPRSAPPTQLEFNFNHGVDVSIYGGGAERRMSISQPTSPSYGYAHHTHHQAQSYFPQPYSSASSPSVWDRSIMKWETSGGQLNFGGNGKGQGTERTWRAPRTDVELVVAMEDLEAAARDAEQHQGGGGGAGSVEAGFDHPISPLTSASDYQFQLVHAAPSPFDVGPPSYPVPYDYGREDADVAGTNPYPDHRTY